MTLSNGPRPTYTVSDRSCLNYNMKYFQQPCITTLKSNNKIMQPSVVIMNRPGLNATIIVYNTLF